jgi:phosphoribosylformylglycinamidine cyclo-ligase
VSKYSAAGVSLDTAEEAKRRIAELVRTTRTPLARGKVGGFGGMVRVPDGYKEPVLVMSTDGVGTKVLVAAAANVHDTVGEDLVNHSVNDILVHGATPLAFLDYFATGTLVPEVAAQVVTGVARGCRAHDMTLAGGETAQLPDLYAPGHYDLAGSIVGVVEEDQAIHGDRIAAGDQLIGYASTGLHTNGYTLARKIVFEWLKLRVDDPFPETNQTVAQVLLAVHRSYVAPLKPLLARVHGLAHITGGGIPGNLSRVLPPGTEAVVDAGSWPWPPVFRVLMRGGQVSRDEMRRVFNLGIGMIAIVARDDVEAAVRAAERTNVGAWLIGEIRAASRKPHASAVRFEER